MIRVVTDSVASLPREILEDDNIEVVSLFVNHNGTEFEDATMDRDEFYAHIHEMIDNIPTSSQPSQGKLEELFEGIAKQGDDVLGIWISSDLSGTFDGALRAARAVESRNIDFRFIMIDSRSCCFDEGCAVIEAAEAVKHGRTLKDAARKALKAIASARILFTPESLTFLQKGGRIGSVSALLGNIMKITPVITVIDGVPEVAAKVRSQKKALKRMVEILEKDIKECGGLKRLVVHYIGDKTPALEWAKNVIEPLIERTVHVLPVSPVIGLHVGPAVGVAYECNKPLEGKVSGNVDSFACAN